MFLSLKFRFEIPSSSSPSWVVWTSNDRTSNDRTSNDPTWGMTTELWESEMAPQLKIRPPTWKIHQWYHNICSSRIFRHSVFRRSNSMFGLSTFSTFRRLGIRRSVIWCWVPIRRWVLFGVQSFGVWSFGVRSFGIRSFDVRSFGVQSFGVQ